MPMASDKSMSTTESVYDSNKILYKPICIVSYDTAVLSFGF